jgi:hypothetical protein
VNLVPVQFATMQLAPVTTRQQANLLICNSLPEHFATEAFRYADISPHHNSLHKHFATQQYFANKRFAIQWYFAKIHFTKHENS